MSPHRIPRLSVWLGGLFCFLLMLPPLPAQSPDAADAIAPLVDSIQKVDNAKLTLNGQDITVNLPYYLDENKNTIISFPVWVRSGEVEYQNHPGQWQPLAATASLRVTPEPLRLRFTLRNLLASEEGRKAVQDRLEQEVSKNLRIERQKLRMRQLQIPQNPETTPFYLTALVWLPQGGTVPLSEPTLLSPLVMQETEGGTVELTLFPDRLQVLAAKLGHPPSLADVRLVIRGPIRARFEKTQMLASLHALRNFDASLRNALKPQTLSASPELLIALPVALTGQAGQQQTASQQLLQYVDITILTRDKASFNKEIITQLFQSLLDNNLRLADQQDQKVVTLLVGQQLSLTATVGELRILSRKNRAEREKLLQKALDEWERGRNQEKHQSDLNFGVNIAGDYAIRPLGIPLGGGSFQGQGTVQTKQDTSQEKEHAQRRQDQLTQFQKALDAVQEHFEGRLPALTGIRLDQQTFQKSYRTIEAQFRQAKFTVGWYDYEWPPLRLVAADPKDLLQQMRQERQNLEQKGNYFIDKLEEQNRQLKKQQDDLKQQLDHSQKKFQELASDLQRTSDTLAQLQENLESLKGGLDNLRKEQQEARLVQLSQEVQVLHKQLLSLRWFLGPRERVLRGHTQATACAAFSPDGSWLASGDSSGKIQLWEAATGRRVHSFHQKATVWALAFSPDGRWLAAGDRSGTIQLWEAATGQEGRSFQQKAIWALAFSPDGRWLAAGDWGGAIQLWEAATGRQVRSFQQKGEVYALAFSPDGRWLAAGDWGGAIQLWEAATGQEGRSFQQKATVWALHWLDANQVLSAAGDRTGALYLLRQDVAGSEQK
jgi:hypothetical protein